MCSLLVSTNPHLSAAKSSALFTGELLTSSTVWCLACHLLWIFQRFYYEQLLLPFLRSLTNLFCVFDQKPALYVRKINNLRLYTCSHRFNGLSSKGSTHMDILSLPQDGYKKHSGPHFDTDAAATKTTGLIV